jgi:hypothetical protein
VRLAEPPFDQGSATSGGVVFGGGKFLDHYSARLKLSVSPSS